MEPQGTDDYLAIGDLEIDFVRRRVWLDGREVYLTTTEFSLLCYLGRHIGWVVPPDVILERVWGPEYIGNHRVLQSTVHRLRGKITACYLITRRGIGYCFGPGIARRGLEPDPVDTID